MFFFQTFVSTMEFTANILFAIRNTSILEWMAILTGIIYLVLITYEKVAAWFFAIISSAIYVLLCFNNLLFLESFLQFFYVIMGVYGWVAWRKKNGSQGKIIRWPWRYHLMNCMGSFILAILVGYVFDVFTNQAQPYTDAMVTVFSLAATYMVTQRVLENWIYWIVIDAVSVYLYVSRGLNMSGVLFAMYTLVAGFGWLKWIREYKKQSV